MIAICLILRSLLSFTASSRSCSLSPVQFSIDSRFLAVMMYSYSDSTWRFVNDAKWPSDEDRSQESGMCALQKSIYEWLE